MFLSSTVNTQSSAPSAPVLTSKVAPSFVLGPLHSFLYTESDLLKPVSDDHSLA